MPLGEEAARRAPRCAASRPPGTSTNTARPGLRAYARDPSAVSGLSPQSAAPPRQLRNIAARERRDPPAGGGPDPRRADRRRRPDGLGDRRAGRPDDHYGALLRAIVGQQLSTKAARTIYGRADRALRRPHADAGGADRRRPRRAARRGRPVESEGVLPALARRARRQRRAGARALRRDARRGGRGRADRREGARPVDGRHVPDVPPRPPRRAARRRPRHQTRRRARLRLRGLPTPPS